MSKRSDIAQMPRLEVHEHRYVSGPEARRARQPNEVNIAHAHVGGEVPHLHPETGPASYRGSPHQKFVTRPNGPQLDYVERPSEEDTFRVIFVDEYTGAHESAGISRERWESERAAFIANAAGHAADYQFGASAEDRMMRTFRLTPIYELWRPEPSDLDEGIDVTTPLADLQPEKRTVTR